MTLAEIELLTILSRAMQSVQSGDTPTALALYADLLERSEGLPNSPDIRQAIEEMAPLFEMLRSLETLSEAGSPRLFELTRSLGDSRPDREEAAPSEHLESAREAARRPGITDAERALLLLAAGGEAMDQGGGQDLGRIEQGVADLRDAVALTSVEHPEYVFRLASLALAVYRRSEVTGSLADVDEAIGMLERARTMARGPAHWSWSFVNDMLSQFGRRRSGSSATNPTAPDKSTRLKPYALTDAEFEVLQLLAGGKGAAAIAAERGVASGTVANQLNEIFRKLGVRSASEAVALAHSERQDGTNRHDAD
ncbi:helix-turn-helix transcriptional regulator [Kribbella sp. CA-293567]|uniref:helix-turn-helix transcriptional regulator n=1 Tax=Kribbella sp. CA-293567 TaxID=3002436 RepID=UPI0022DE1C68|nr:LuxR C-terminal-related transcriptional regulator [Kribbella sp. CA-293567]WBQ04442.1 LuxR C-terminal-related transcriptional regulator [Kribbella sp. CA-293567]